MNTKEGITFDPAPAVGDPEPVIPSYHADIHIYRDGDHNQTLHVSVNGPPQYVARMVAAAGDAFEDEATR